MYRIIIIDGDATESEGLSSMINEDFSIDGIFDNCDDAIAFAKQNTVDIAIIDAACDTESVSKLMESGTEILMLCGYRQLDSAKKMSDIGVNFYLLKPVRYDEFSYALASVQLSLNKRNIARLQNLSSLDFEQFMPILREQFFADVANGKISSRQELREKASELPIEQSICGMSCGIAEVHITEYHNYVTNKWKYGRETLYTAIKNLLSDTDQFSFQLVKTNGSIMRFVVVPSRHISVKTMGDSLRLHIIKSTRSAFELFGLLLFINIKKIFASLFEMMEYTYANGLDNIADEPYSDNIGQLISCIKMYHTEEAGKILNDCRITLKDSSPENTATFLLNILYIVCDSLFSGEVLAEMRKRVESTLIRNNSDNNELFDGANEVVSDFVGCLKKNSKRSDDIVISKAKQFIKNNCRNDISLNDVAEYVYLTPVYFSRMFKQKTGETFSAYLLRIRMEMAVQFFERGGAKVREVALAVGFKNAKYFSKLFKNYTGCTPKEYLYMHFEREKDV